MQEEGWLKVLLSLSWSRRGWIACSDFPVDIINFTKGYCWMTFWMTFIVFSESWPLEFNNVPSTSLMCVN